MVYMYSSGFLSHMISCATLAVVLHIFPGTRCSSVVYPGTQLALDGDFTAAQCPAIVIPVLTTSLTTSTTTTTTTTTTTFAPSKNTSEEGEAGSPKPDNLDIQEPPCLCSSLHLEIVCRRLEQVPRIIDSVEVITSIVCICN